MTSTGKTPVMEGQKEQGLIRRHAFSTELYKEIDWITRFLPANSGQSGLTLQLKQLFQL